MVKIKNGKKVDGSVLVFTLIILIITLVVALGVAQVTVTERRSSGATGQSTKAFQIADSGTEIALKEILKNNKTKPSELVTALGAACNGTEITWGSYKIIAKDTGGTPIVCTDNSTNIDKIKSIGTYSNTSRAVEVKVCGMDIWNLNNTFTCANFIGDSTTYNGKLYYGTGQNGQGNNGCVKLYSYDGSSWTEIYDFFANNGSDMVYALYDGFADLNGYLWIGVGGRDFGNGGIFRYKGGTVENVFDFNSFFGSGTSGKYQEIYSIIYFKGYFYAAAGGTNNARIFRSSTGDIDTWTQVYSIPNAYQARELWISSVGSKLYFTSGQDNTENSSVYEARIFSTADGISWTNEWDSDYRYVYDKVFYKGKLYLSSHTTTSGPFERRGTVYQCTEGATLTCTDLRTIISTMQEGAYGGMAVYDNILYIGAGELFNVSGPTGEGGIIFSYDGVTSWNKEYDLPNDARIWDIKLFNNKLYESGEINSTYYAPSC
ncbi:MAG: hypothetical protein A3J63_02325 [Candidatus Moranbacteria bacterium RIFCSPHIGHO2_02_FULL_40_12b]|nr:MAG: hypothetical protein A3J63_02325 [Candidatus Moranbacteria bacterium RIFCSPHIGHO2_02_FULL_40_12b]